MSLSDIVQYVRNTPGNTNPNVVKSMVEGEMNFTLEESKAYTDSQRLAYSESLILEFDGNIEDKETINFYNETYVRVTDSPVDLKYLNSFCIKNAENSVVVTLKMVELAEEEYGQSLELSSKKVVLNVQREYSSLKPGIYVWYQSSNAYIEQLNFNEILHTIDPKYLPLGCAGSSYKKASDLLSETILDGFEEQDLDLGYPIYMTQGLGLWEAFHTSLPKNDASGTTYPVVVVWDEKIYHTTVTYIYEMALASTQYILGQFDRSDPTKLFEKEPFICISEWGDAWITKEEGSHKVQVYIEEEVINQIDPKYAQDILEIAKDYTDGKSIKKEDIIDSFPGGIGYSIFSKVENVLPETVLYSGDDLSQNLNLRQGQNYTVVINGEAITARAKKVITSMECESVVLGNLSLTPYDGKDTGEDFFIGEYYYEAGTYYNKFFLRELSYATVEVYVEEEVIHQIDSKFLPDSSPVLTQETITSLLPGGVGATMPEAEESIYPKTVLNTYTTDYTDIPTQITLQSGKDYQVIINDKSYIRTAYTVEGNMGIPVVILGNGGLIPSLRGYIGDNGDEFFLGRFIDHSYNEKQAIALKNPVNGLELTVNSVKWVVHQISPEYITPKYAPNPNTEESIPTFTLLKGPDSKLYQLTIDENGALKVNEGIQTLGRDKFTFDIYTEQYEAEEGMTWYLWCNSSYNTGNFMIVDNEVHYIPWIDMFNPQVLNPDNYEPVEKYSIIEQKRYDLSP